MYPTICNGDVITVVPFETIAISVGDIILYRHKSGVTAHRVIRIVKKNKAYSRYSLHAPRISDPIPLNLFLLRGDSAPVFDDPVSADQILGKVTIVEREGRSINPYSLKADIRLKIRRLASILKRFCWEHRFRFLI